MEKKAVSGIMLTLLLISLFTFALDTLLVKATLVTISEQNSNSTASLDVVRAPQGYLQGRDALHGVDLKDAAWNLKRYGSEVGSEHLLSSYLNPQEIETSRSRFLPNYKWDFNRAAEWRDFAYVDEDSAELVIGLRDTRPNSYSELVNLIVGYGGEFVSTVSMDGKIAAVVADIPFVVMSTFVSEVEIAGLSRYIEPNMKFEIDFTPNDPDWPEQWGSHRIEADWAWNTTMGDTSVLVSVIDTGVDWNHPDLAANYVPLGYDWVNNDNDPMDDQGHGTHCAGIIAAVLNNSIGIAGLAQVRIMAEKAINKSGQGWEDDYAKAIIHSADQGADIISMSWGRYATGWSSLLYEALKYAYDRGLLLVAAAGNDAWSLKLYPAAYDEVIAVSATDKFDKPAEFTNFGDWIEVAAPGVGIYSTMWDDSYAYMSGTSMSTPYVAGVAALIWSRFPNMTRDQVRIQLRRTADDLGNPGFDEFFGYGRVNARNAVEQVLPNDDLLISEWNITRWAKPEDLTTANVTVLNFGKRNQSNVIVQLVANGDVVDSALIEFLTSGKSAPVNLAWSPTKEGIYNVTMYIVPVLSEKIVENNAISTHVLVRIAKVIHVPSDFQTIKEAIDIASSDFTIYVASGLYRGHLVIYKSLKLVGEHPSTTFIDGNGIGTVIIAFSTSNISISGVTIQNSLKIWGRYSFGIYLVCTNGSSINNNVVQNNNFGICLDCSDDNNITNNTILNNKATGFVLSSSNCNNVINNGVLNNGASGILLEYSTNNTLRNNDASGNWLNFGVDGDSLCDFINNVDSSNTVNGKPIYYWINQHDKEVPAGAGYVAVINSTRVKVSGSNLTNNSEGLLLAYTTKSVIENVNTSDNSYGIRLFRSNNNNVNDNTIKNNWLGIHVFNSSDNKLSANRIDTYELLKLSHKFVFLVTEGIYVDSSQNNTIMKNTISYHNFGGICIGGSKLLWSSGNLVIGNTVTNDAFFGIALLVWSRNNAIIENKASSNSLGIWIDSSDNNAIYHNNFVDNSIQAYLDQSFNNIWDDGYPSGGNYWSDYNGTDLYSGPYQNVTGYDGIGDTPYTIDANNKDRFPYMIQIKGPYIPGDLNHDGKVDIRDLAVAAEAFGSYPSHPRWNPLCDIDHDGKVDIRDVALIAKNFGKAYS